MKHDEKLLEDFCAAARGLIEQQLHRARESDPEAYAELVQLVRERRCRPRLVAQLDPIMVSFQLVDQGGQAIAEFFRYEGRRAERSEVH